MANVRKHAQRIVVRGICTAGHVVERRAHRGRLTWTGPCPAEGCGLPVVARRTAAALAALRARHVGPPPDPGQTGVSG